MNNTNSVFDGIDFIDDDLIYLSRDSIKRITPSIKELSVRFVCATNDLDDILKSYGNLTSNLSKDEKSYVYGLMLRYINNLLGVLTGAKTLSKKRER